MSDGKRTTKILKGTFTLIFHGDYIPLDECEQYFQNWADGGLHDRSDLREWEFKVTGKTEIHGDPEGYDWPPADSPEEADDTECVDAEWDVHPEHDFPDDGRPCRRCDAEAAYLGDGS